MNEVKKVSKEKNKELNIYSKDVEDFLADIIISN